MLLTDKKILVTGSSRGIGYAAARAMLDLGASVVFSSERSIDDDICGDVRDALKNPKASYIRADFSKEGEPATLVAEAFQKLGGLDVLVNNVGTYREPDFLEIMKNDFDAIFNLNVWSAIRATQEFVRLNRSAKRGGRILFTTSLNATRSEPAHTLYDASKGAVNALVRQLAVELAPHGFTTAAIAPGLIETPLTDMGLRGDPAARQAIIDQIPVGRIGTVADVAMWYAFLASDHAMYTTGAIINIDGGLDAQQMSLRPIGQNEKIK
jgi:glucose 1-dehydrogenase